MNNKPWPLAFRRRYAEYSSELKSLYMELYHQNTAFNEFVEMLFRLWSERGKDLRALDKARLADPDWYKKREMLGMQMYVGAFAGNLEGVRGKLKYIQDCGVNYLHLMPLLESPKGRSDGGYAVSDFRKVQPELGTMGIPAIIGVGDQLKAEYAGREVIVDGGTGSVVLDADEDTRVRMMKKRAEILKRQELLAQLKGQPNVTKDGQEIRVFCNIGNPEDVHAVLENDGGGIGLFRSEFLYLNCDDYPTEEYQFEAYKKVLSDMGGKEVVIRTLDIGADKMIEYFHLPEEENPALGNRALRICLNRPEIFRTQLRALYRASAFGRLSIMFPMVTSVWEVREAKKMCEQVKKELTAEGIPFSDEVDVGIMIETPAAAVISDRLAKEVDFFSIGTNDLTQYTLACDRQNNDLGRFFNAHHPAVLRLIKMACDNAHKEGIWCGICGELGADLELTELFLAIGLDELSVSPRSVLPLRQKVRETQVRVVREKLLGDLMSDANTI